MADTMTNKRLLGVAVPVGALRSAASAGVGEFPDLVEFAQLCKTMGIGIIQLLPVNDTGYESSPYGALTAFGLNPIYLRISDIPEAADFAPDLQAIAKEFEGQARFPYLKIARAKMALLRRIFNDNRDKIERDVRIDVWLDKNTWIKEYAVFRRLKEANDEKSWKAWKAFTKVTQKDIEALWNDKKQRYENLFWTWLQMLLDNQFVAAADAVAGMGIILKGDIPILMNEDSCDVWAHPEYFHQSLSAGAPPDMYSPDGQNWGFPIYNWQTQEEDKFTWWKARIATAAKYYKAFRIDHVLGFFRIWAISRRNSLASTGRFVPAVPIKLAELQELYHDEGRIKWITMPHIPTHEVWEAVQREGHGSCEDVERVFGMALERVGSEELWLFKNFIKHDKDIEALDIHPAGRVYLMRQWSNRIFQAYDKDSYSPLWNYRNSRAYATFSGEEREILEDFLYRKQQSSEKSWESNGKKLLSVLQESSPMLACAEDLGVLNECVPRVLNKLKILSLKVIRWERAYNEEGQPYRSFSDYPELSVCTTSVHDSSTLREWWETEADQNAFAAFSGYPSLPKIYNPGTARKFLFHAASALSRFRIFPLIDFLHLTSRWYADNPASERINVPGTSNEFNWTWRLPATVAEIAKDTELIKAVKELSLVEAAKKTKKTDSEKKS